MERKQTMLRNRIKEVLDGGGAALGTWVSMNSPENCEVAAAAGFDFVIIDAEHGNFGIEGAVDLIRAIEAGGATPVIRVLDSSPTTIQKSLEAGAPVVFVSEVQTGEEVARIVRCAKYPPAGRRGTSSYIRATMHGVLDWKEYREWTRDNVMVWVMIENNEAVEEIAAILAAGVDAICVGPTDLSMFMGLEGDEQHPAVLEAESRIVKLAVEKGLDVIADLDCMKAGDMESEDYLEAARIWEERGCRIMTVMNDRQVLGQTYQKIVGRFRESG